MFAINKLKFRSQRTTCSNHTKPLQITFEFPWATHTKPKMNYRKKKHRKSNWLLTTRFSFSSLTFLSINILYVSNVNIFFKGVSWHIHTSICFKNKIKLYIRGIVAFLEKNPVIYMLFRYPECQNETLRWCILSPVHLFIFYEILSLINHQR